MFVHSDRSRVLEMSAVSAAVAGAMRVVYTLLFFPHCAVHATFVHLMAAAEPSDAILQYGWYSLVHCSTTNISAECMPCSAVSARPQWWFMVLCCLLSAGLALPAIQLATC